MLVELDRWHGLAELVTTSFASRGSGVQIPSSPLGNTGQSMCGTPVRSPEDHLSPKCHPDQPSGTGSRRPQPTPTATRARLFLPRVGRKREIDLCR